VRLNPEDARGFDGYRETVETELADALHARARSRGFRLLARPTVAIEASTRVQVADIDVICDVVDRRALEAGRVREDLQLSRGPHGTGVFAPTGVRAATPPAVVQAPPASLEAAWWDPPMAGDGRVAPSPAVSGGSMSPPMPMAAALPSPAAQPTSAAAPSARIEVRTRGVFMAGCEFRGGTARIGRGSENDIVLGDDRVSRRHGQLSARQGTLVYTDLGSTNGSFVNGTRVREIVLGSGDVVRLGNSTLTIQPHA
jgi:hypothetical protein